MKKTKFQVVSYLTPETMEKLKDLKAKSGKTQKECSYGTIIGDLIDKYYSKAMKKLELKKEEEKNTEVEQA